MTEPTVTAPDDCYLLSLKYRSDHGCLWWGPNRSSYVFNLGQAGRYSKAEAESLTRGSADAVVAVPCIEVDQLAQRFVPDKHIEAFRKLARACDVHGCREHVSDDNARCAKCVAGDACSTVHDPRGGSTWCGKSMMERGSRTFADHERATWDRNEVTCQPCIDARVKQEAEFRLLHRLGCDYPYCEGCRTCDDCGRKVDDCVCDKALDHDEEEEQA